MDAFIAGIISGASGLHGACAENSLDSYLKAIGADLPLPVSAEGWWTWMRPPKITMAVLLTCKPRLRWRPFSSY